MGAVDHASAWGLSWGAAWGKSWGGRLGVTDTEDLELPVNAVLAGMQLIYDRYTEFDIRPMGLKQKTTLTASKSGRLSGDAPTFTVRTDNKGYN